MDGTDRATVPVALGTALVLLTYVTPVISLPRTAVDVDAGAAGRAWILSSMSVGLAAALLAAGVVGDTWGRRRTYRTGLLALAAGAAGVAVAPDVGLLVAARIVEGVGGAAVLACGLAVLTDAAQDGTRRARAAAIWGASVGFGIGSGAVVAAALAGLGSGWRETYGLSAVAALALVGVSRALPESRAEHPRAIDVPGLVLLGGGLTLLVSTLTQARDGIDGVTVVLAGSALVALVAFGVVEARVSSPLVEPALLRHPGFVTATVGSLVLGVGMIGLASYSATIAQVGLGLGTWSAASVSATWAAVSVATSLLLRRLPWTFERPRHVAAVLVLLAFGQLLAWRLSPDSGLWRLLLALAVSGLGTGVLNAVLGRESVASVPPDRAAMGSGANNTARYTGAAVGITLFVVISGHVGHDPVDGWNVAVLVAVAVTLLGALVVATQGRRMVPAPDAEVSAA